MDSANEMCDRLLAFMRREGWNCTIVNGEKTDDDSVCEHAMDIDVDDVSGWDWSVQLTVLRIGRPRENI